jgi:hypothetical protein
MPNTATLPRWANDILNAAPKRGEGLNPWLFRASIALRACGRNEQEITAELRVLTAGEPTKPGEIERAAKRSADYVDGHGTDHHPAPKWPCVDKAARAAVIAQHDGGAVELWEQSPVRLDDDSPITEAIIDTLFPGDPLICVAPVFNVYETAPRESFRGRLSKMQFIVPNAMSKLTGLTQDGEESARCLDNTGPRQYLIVEQDSGTMDEQAGVIMHLAKKAPLALVTRSGGKSLHSWFACGDQLEDDVKRFFTHAVALGADPATWTRCQLVRMPDGTRPKDGAAVRQSVLYWNPSIREASL